MPTPRRRRFKRRPLPISRRLHPWTSRLVARISPTIHPESANVSFPEVWPGRTVASPPRASSRTSPRDDNKSLNPARLNPYAQCIAMYSSSLAVAMNVFTASDTRRTSFALGVDFATFLAVARHPASRISSSYRQS